jgi:hypothetical protein
LTQRRTQFSTERKGLVSDACAIQALRFFDAILASTNLWDQVKTTTQVEQAARPDSENREPPGALQRLGKLGVIVIEKRSVAPDESGLGAGF